MAAASFLKLFRNDIIWTATKTALIAGKRRKKRSENNQSVTCLKRKATETNPKPCPIFPLPTFLP